jgi:intracellular multiplication protein IcmV
MTVKIMKRDAKQPGFTNKMKRVFNVRMWSDADRLKSFALYIVETAKLFFVPKKQEITESFEEARVRLNLDEHALTAREKFLFRLSLLMVFFAVAFFMYAAYEFFNGYVLNGFLTLAVMCIALVLAFRYHFWYFQIRHRKLGCTFSEWLKQGLLGEKQ